MSKTEKIIAMLESERDAIEDEWGPGYAGGIEAAIAYLRTPEAQTEEALLPIIAEMKGLIERQERHADEATTQGALAKYLQIYVTKLEHLPRTPEGQEMFAIDRNGTLCAGSFAYVEDHAWKFFCDIREMGDISMPGDEYKVVTVMVTRKED